MAKPFSLDRFKTGASLEMPVEPAAPSARPRKPRQIPRSELPFVKMPLPWGLYALMAAKMPGALVICALLYKSRFGDEWVELTADALHNFQISPRSRTRVLRQLEAARLVAVRWRGRQAPWVKLLSPESWHPCPPILTSRLQTLKTRETRWAPGDLLAALGPAPPAEHWPRSRKQLAALLRQTWPRSVGTLHGRAIICLDQIP
jgi:hypothetical protein